MPKTAQMYAKVHVHHVYTVLKSMQRSRTEAIRTQIKPSKPTWEITKITKESKYKENIWSTE